MDPRVAAESANDVLRRHWTADTYSRHVRPAVVDAVAADYDELTSMSKVRLLLASALALDSYAHRAQQHTTHPPDTPGDPEAAAANAARRQELEQEQQQMVQQLQPLVDTALADDDDWVRAIAAAVSRLDGRADLGALCHASPSDPVSPRRLRNLHNIQAMVGPELGVCLCGLMGVGGWCILDSCTQQGWCGAVWCACGGH